MQILATFLHSEKTKQKKTTFNNKFKKIKTSKGQSKYKV